MILALDTINKSLEVVLGAVVATNQPQYFTTYADVTDTLFTESSTAGALNSTTPVTVVPAPAADVRRMVKTLNIHNTDTANITLTVQYKDGVTTVPITTITIPPGDTYTLDGVYDSAGRKRIASSTVWGSITGDLDSQTDLRNELDSIVANTINGTTLNLQLDLPDPDINNEIHVSGNYLITGTIDIGTNEIVLDGETHFVGLNASDDFLIYSGINAAVRGTGFTFTAVHCAFSTPNGKAFNLVGGANQYFTLLYVGLDGQAAASILDGFQEYAVLELCGITGGAGVEFDGITGKAGVFNTYFRGITGPEVKALTNFDGLLAIGNNFFKDLGGAHIEAVSLTNTRIRITTNDFVTNTGTSFFVGFTEEDIGVSVVGNTNQVDSRVALDAYFVSNATAQTVTTTWVDIDQAYTVEYAQRIAWDALTNSFNFLDAKDALIRFDIDLYAESAANNEDFEFAIFRDTGTGFTLYSPIYPYSFNTAGVINFITIKERITIPPGSKFKMRMRKPAGSSNITIVSSKAIV